VSDHVHLFPAGFRRTDTGEAIPDEGLRDEHAADRACWCRPKLGPAPAPYLGQAWVHRFATRREAEAILRLEDHGRASATVGRA
jgi:hypothetical protein